MHSSAVLEKARLSRDVRFDGRFYIGVKTTGIYCRPICPANMPKSENVAFYPTAAAAGEAGFRPCLRCRPECAPGSPAWAGTSTTVRRGLRLIADGALDEGDIEGLADRLGVTGRHLRRLFQEHVGASPLAVAHTQRLQLAKKLIDETGLPISSIAISAGFGSARRFNDAFKKVYGKAPRQLRRKSAEKVSDAFTVRLPYRKPYNANALLEFFGARAIPGVESLHDGHYLRSVDFDGAACVIDVANVADSLELSLHGAGTVQLLSLIQRVRRLFDLDASPHDVAAVLTKDGFLKQCLRTNSGIRVPGAWDGFEVTVRAILGQQVSVAAATTLAGRVAKRYGTPLNVTVPGRTIGVPTHLFPKSEQLLGARLRDLGIINSRADTIRRLARAVCDGEVSFDPAQETGEFCRSLVSLKGIGDWTAQYVAMRAMKDPDAFPDSDLGLLRAFDDEIGERMKPAALRARAEAWRPWRSYAALLLWSSDNNSGG